MVLKLENKYIKQKQVQINASVAPIFLVCKWADNESHNSNKIHY